MHFKPPGSGPRSSATEHTDVVTLDAFCATPASSHWRQVYPHPLCTAPMVWTFGIGAFVLSKRKPSRCHLPPIATAITTWREPCPKGSCRVSFTTTLYNPPKRPLPPDPSIFLQPRDETPLEQRLSPSPLVVETGTAQVSSRFVSEFHVPFLLVAYSLSRLRDPRSGVSL